MKYGVSKQSMENIRNQACWRFSATNEFSHTDNWFKLERSQRWPYENEQTIVMLCSLMNELEWIRTEMSRCTCSMRMVLAQVSLHTRCAVALFVHLYSTVGTTATWLEISSFFISGYQNNFILNWDDLPISVCNSNFYYRESLQS